MSGTRSLFALLALLLILYVGWRVYTRLPWIRIAARVHAEHGALNCGDVKYSEGRKAATAAINCAMAAQAERRPFRVTFSVPGTDEAVYHALVGDSQGGAVELMYAIGMVETHDTLLQHRCSSPVQLQIEDNPYGIPLLHCAPWPPNRFERDWLLW